MACLEWFDSSFASRSAVGVGSESPGSAGSSVQPGSRKSPIGREKQSNRAQQVDPVIGRWVVRLASGAVVDAGFCLKADGQRAVTQGCERPPAGLATRA